MKKRSQNKLELKKRAISNLKNEALKGGRFDTFLDCPTAGTCNKSICAYCEPLGG